MRTIAGVRGIRFAVWAPNAERVSVVGPFNHWDGRYHPMSVRGSSGVWELFLPELGAGELYKYELYTRDSRELRLKTDPYGAAFENRPATASITAQPSTFAWDDAAWLEQRARRDWLKEPISIYEVHLGSWRRNAAGNFLSYREIAVQLGEYVKDLGFTHVELLPITEHPFDDSWGYQCTGYFAPTSRHGSPDGLRALVAELHRQGIGVLLDWVPGHFPKDDHALARFDGTALYEYGDRQKGEHPDWDTLVFNYARNEVQSFLLSSAICWLEDFHFDGLRVDAVASMLYLDYSRKPHQWTPNQHGGNENLEAIAFLRRLNETTYATCPGTITAAEESTAWPQVSRPTYTGGLGFTFKWNMGWMNDTLRYVCERPRAPPLPSRLTHVRADVRVHGEFRAAVVARRGRARQTLAARQDAGRRLATVCKPAVAADVPMDVSRQETVVHGRRIRPTARVEPSRRTTVALGRGAPPRRSARARAGSEPRVPQHAGTASFGP